MVHYDTLKEMQQIFYTHFGDKLESFAIKTVGKIDSKEKLKEIFSYLSIEDLKFLAYRLNFFIGDLSQTSSACDDGMYRYLRGFMTEKEVIEEI